MDALPQVGQKYQHKKWGEVEVGSVNKVGRGYQVALCSTKWIDDLTGSERFERVPLNDFIRDASPCNP